MVDSAWVAAELDAEESRLRRQLGRLTAPVEDGASIGFGKRIGDGTIQAVQQMADASSAQILQQALDAVLRARAKLDAGTYGTCDGCGEAIDPDRLEFRPWASECVDCASRHRR